MLTHWGRVTHICVGKLTIIGSDNGLSPERRQAIIWTNAGILLIEPLRTNFIEILIEIQTFSMKKIRFKMSSAKCSFRLSLNVLKYKVSTSNKTDLTTVQPWTIASIETHKISTNITERKEKTTECTIVHSHTWEKSDRLILSLNVLKEEKSNLKLRNPHKCSVL